MDIRFNPNVSGKFETGQVKSRAGNQKAFFNITDKVGSAVNTEAGYSKPVIQNEKTGESADVKSGKIADAESASAGMTSVPGPSAAVVSKQIEQLNRIGVKILKKRALPIPFMGGKAVSADEAAGILTGNDDSEKGKLLVETGKGTQVPLTDLEDLKEVSVFKGLSSEKLVNDDMADFIRYGGSIGLKFNSDKRKDVGEYGAYNLISEGWEKAGVDAAPIKLVRDGITLMTLKPDQKFDVKAAKKELEATWAAYDKLVGFEDGKAKGNKYLKTLNKPLYDMSFLERFNAMDHMNPYCGRALRNYQMVAKKAVDKAEFLDVVDILDNMELLGYDKYPEFNQDDVKQMMTRKGDNDASPRQKSEVLRDIRKSIGATGSCSGKEHQYINYGFDLVHGASKNEADFLKLANLFVETSKALHATEKFDTYELRKEFKNAKKAFKFIADNLKGDVTESTAFIGILRVNGNVDESIKRFNYIQPPIKNEDITTRVETARVLAASDNFDDYYRTVLESLQPGDNAVDCASLMRSIEINYKPEPLNGKKMFVDAKRYAQTNRANINDFRDLVRTYRSGPKVFNEVIYELKEPVAGETFGNRKSLMVKLRENHKCDYESDRDKRNYDNRALNDYKAIRANVVEGETLDSAAARFQMLFEKLDGKYHHQEVRDAYMVLSEGIKQGGVNVSKDVIQKAILEGKDVNEIRARIKEGITETVADIKKHGKDGKKIVDGDDAVIIGGVQLEKKRFDNLLKVLDS